MLIQYIVRRILTSIPVLFGILLVTFALARLIPGDPCRAILGEKATKAFASYVEEVRNRQFPQDQHTYNMVEGEFDKLVKLLK